MVRAAFFEKSEVFQISRPIIVGAPLVHVRRVCKNLCQIMNIECKNVAVKELF